MKPTLRKPFGIFFILLIIAVWSIIVASLSGIVGTWPVLAQALFYVVAGTVWIMPLRPLLMWMETGRFRLPKDGQ
jgi:hypothetical protein